MRTTAIRFGPGFCLPRRLGFIRRGSVPGPVRRHALALHWAATGVTHAGRWMV